MTRKRVGMNFNTTNFFGLAPSFVGFFLLCRIPIWAADCNGNGIEDADDVRTRNFALGAPSYPVGTDPVAATAADFDGDGTIDLATANEGSQDLSLLFNRGDGTFKDEVRYRARLEGSSPLI